MADRNTKTRLAAVALCLLSGACAPYLGTAVARDVDRTVPEDFGAKSGSASAAKLTVREFFGDPQLVALVDEALANNQELNMIAQEITIANSEILARQGEYQPMVGVGASAGIEKVGRYTSQGAADEANEIKPGRGVPENLQNYGAGFFASWEIDVWGKLHDATKAAVYRFLSSVEGRRFATTRLVGEIARSWFELMALDNQLDVLRRNIEIQNSALDVVRAQKAAGRVTELAVQRFEAEVLHNQSRLFDVQQRITVTENRLNLLVGRYPQRIERASQGFLQRTPVVVETGVPMQLLENRPDLKQAEMALSAAKLDVAVAKANFYPSLSVEGRAGVEAFETKSLTIWPESLVYGAIAGVAAPLWNRKALTAGYYAANARQMQAVYGFERTLRQAYAEVANLLAQVQNLGGKYQLKARQVDILRQAIDVSNNLFASARADYMEVLLTRRDALESQMELIETRQQQFGAMVEMYQALGGGWRDPDGADSAEKEKTVGPVQDIPR